jgi:hypothetical protein
MSQDIDKHLNLEAALYRRLTIQSYREGKRDGIEEAAGYLGYLVSELLPHDQAAIVLSALLETMRIHNITDGHVHDLLMTNNVALRMAHEAKHDPEAFNRRIAKAQEKIEAEKAEG